MIGAIIRRLVTQEIAKQAAAIRREVPLPIGYNPLEVIRAGMFQMVAVPFNGVPVWMELRTLNRTQIDACGGMTLIDMGDVKEPTREQVIEMRNKQEQLVRAVCNKPTFDEIEKDLFGIDFIASESRKRLAELKAVDLKSLEPKEREEIEDGIFNIELSLAFILPEDAFGFLTAWALGVDVSNIKKLTKDQLLEAAILATNGHDNPHDHISGIFTDRDSGDIDKTAWGLYNEYQHEKEIEKNSKSRFIKTGRNKE